MKKSIKILALMVLCSLSTDSTHAASRGRSRAGEAGVKMIQTLTPAEIKKLTEKFRECIKTIEQQMPEVRGRIHADANILDEQIRKHFGHDEVESRADAAQQKEEHAEVKKGIMEKLEEAGETAVEIMQDPETQKAVGALASFVIGIATGAAKKDGESTADYLEREAHNIVAEAQKDNLGGALGVLAKDAKKVNKGCCTLF